MAHSVCVCVCICGRVLVCLRAHWSVAEALRVALLTPDSQHPPKHLRSRVGQARLAHADTSLIVGRVLLKHGKGDTLERHTCTVRAPLTADPFGRFTFQTESPSRPWAH